MLGPGVCDYVVCGESIREYIINNENYGFLVDISMFTQYTIVCLPETHVHNAKTALSGWGKINKQVAVSIIDGLWCKGFRYLHKKDEGLTS